MEILGVGLLVLLVTGILIGLRQPSRSNARRQKKRSGPSAPEVDPTNATFGRIDEGRAEIGSDISEGD